MITAETLETTFPSTHPESRLVAIAAPESTAAQQYRVLLHRIDRLAERRPVRILAVTSAARGEGRTTTAANLALTAARDGRPTLLLEADLRRPSLATLLELVPRAGLAEVVAGTAEIGAAIAHVGPLAVLCAGDVRDAAETLRNPRVATVMEALRASYTLVVVDAPPALAFADGDRLAGAADAAVLVVRAHQTPRAMVKFALEALGDRAAGIVLNGLDPVASTQPWLVDAGATPAAR